GIDPDPAFAIRQNAERALERGLVPRHRWCNGSGTFELALFNQHSERDDNRDRSRLARFRQRERLVDRARNLADVLDVVDALCHLLEHADVGQLVELEWLVLVSAGHIADDANERNTVE